MFIHNTQGLLGLFAGDEDIHGKGHFRLPWAPSVVLMRAGGGSFGWSNSSPREGIVQPISVLSQGPWPPETQQCLSSGLVQLYTEFSFLAFTVGTFSLTGIGFSS